MTLAQRRIVYLFFMAVFLSLAPLIILYSNGYRYDTKKKILQKTGIIFLESKPENIEIYLNDKFIAKKTPIRIQNLLPNEYELKLKKEGYREWYKKINVTSGQTFFLQYVRLFRNDSQPKRLLEGEMEMMVSDESNNYIFIVEKLDEIYRLAAFNPNREETRIIFETTNKINGLEPLENGKKIAVITENNIWLVDNLQNGNQIEIDKIIGKIRMANVKFDKYNADNIFYLEEDQLVRLNLISRDKKILAEAVNDYAIDGSLIYFLSADSLNKIFLKKFDILNEIKIETLGGLENSRDYKIRQADKDVVTIEKGNELYIWETRKGAYEKIKDAKYYEWNDERSELLFGDESEIWIYRTENKKNDNYTLITRHGETISQIKWYKPETHILYISDNKLKVSESLISNRYQDELLKIQEIKDFIINKKGDRVYFIGKIDERSGFYELEIQ